MIDNESLSNIENLHRLKAEGIITETEFEDAKRRILFGSAPKQSSAFSPPAYQPSIDEHMTWITMPLRRFADFRGRSRRREFWMFQLIYLALALAGVVFVGGTADAYGGWSPFGNIVAGLIILALIGLFVPLLAVEVRRLHDQGRSGFLVLLNLIPYLGVVIVLILMAIPGTVGENRFGPDPKQL